MLNDLLKCQQPNLIKTYKVALKSNVLYFCEIVKQARSLIFIYFCQCHIIKACIYWTNEHGHNTLANTKYIQPYKSVRPVSTHFRDRHWYFKILTTRILCPIAFAGRLLLNLARTIPLFPWARVTLPQMTRVLLGLPPGVAVFLQTTYKTHIKYVSKYVSQLHSNCINVNMKAIHNLFYFQNLSFHVKHDIQ